jgi:hypothetical protein
MILFLKDCYFPQGVFDSAIGVLNFLCLLLLRSPQRMEFITVAFRDVGGASRQFGLEPSPYTLFILLVLGQKQPEGFLGAQLGDSGKVFHPEAIQHLSPFQMSFAQTQRAFDGFSEDW